MTNGCPLFPLVISSVLHTYTWEDPREIKKKLINSNHSSSASMLTGSCFSKRNWRRQRGANTYTEIPRESDPLHTNLIIFPLWHDSRCPQFPKVHSRPSWSSYRAPTSFSFLYSTTIELGLVWSINMLRRAGLCKWAMSLLMGAIFSWSGADVWSAFATLMRIIQFCSTTFTCFSQLWRLVRCEMN